MTRHRFGGESYLKQRLLCRSLSGVCEAGDTVISVNKAATGETVAAGTRTGGTTATAGIMTEANESLKAVLKLNPGLSAE